VLVSSQLDQSSEPQSPAEGLAESQEGWEAGYDPAPGHSLCRLRCHYASPTSSELVENWDADDDAVMPHAEPLHHAHHHTSQFSLDDTPRENQ
jgi:hypothetical protein